MTPTALHRRLAQQEARALRLLHRHGGRTVSPLNTNVSVEETTPILPCPLANAARWARHVAPLRENVA
jgi:hypothetical protein